MGRVLPDSSPVRSSPRLGRAAAAFPRIEGSLRTAAPAGLDLDTRGAHEFLTHGASALEQAGFGVLLPSWWTRGGPRVRLMVKGTARPPRMKSTSGLSLDALILGRMGWRPALPA